MLGRREDRGQLIERQPDRHGDARGGRRVFDAVELALQSVLEGGQSSRERCSRWPRMGEHLRDGRLNHGPFRVDARALFVSVSCARRVWRQNVVTSLFTTGRESPYLAASPRWL